MITAEELALLEKYSEEYGVSRAELMENAGRAFADMVRSHFRPGDRVLIIAYHGNNGGDGFVIARHLKDLYHIRVWFVGETKKLRRPAKINYEKLPEEMFVQDPDLREYNVIIDAMLGTGTHGALKQPLAGLVDKWNLAECPKLAVDIPTGIDPDTGEHDGYFEADIIGTFHDMKPGLKEFEEETRILDIGIPEEACERLRKKT